MGRREKLLQHKKDLGRKASYSTLGDMVGKDKRTVQVVLKDMPSVIPINREEILNAIEEALDELEAEEENDPTAAYAA